MCSNCLITEILHNKMYIPERDRGKEEQDYDEEEEEGEEEANGTTKVQKKREDAEREVEPRGL